MSRAFVRCFRFGIRIQTGRVHPALAEIGLPPRGGRLPRGHFGIDGSIWFGDDIADRPLVRFDLRLICISSLWREGAWCSGEVNRRRNTVPYGPLLDNVRGGQFDIVFDLYMTAINRRWTVFGLVTGAIVRHIFTSSFRHFCLNLKSSKSNLGLLWNIDSTAIIDTFSFTDCICRIPLKGT